MQKRKVYGEWQITLTQAERKRLSDAACVLTDLHELDANTKAVRDGVRSILNCINEDGVYSEAVPETEPSDA